MQSSASLRWFFKIMEGMQIILSCSSPWGYLPFVKLSHTGKPGHERNHVVLVKAGVNRIVLSGCKYCRDLEKTFGSVGDESLR